MQADAHLLAPCWQPDTGLGIPTWLRASCWYGDMGRAASKWFYGTVKHIREALMCAEAI